MNPTTTSFVEVQDLLRTYYDALYHGDVERLRDAFHPGATYATGSGGDLLQLGVEEYMPRVAARESPADLGDVYGYEVESIEFAGAGTALVRMRSSMLGLHFTDFLSLVQIDGAWRIAAKVFHFHEEN